MDKIVSGYREFADQFLERQIQVVQKFKIILADRFDDCVSSDELISTFSQELDIALRSLFIASGPRSHAELQNVLTVIAGEYVEKYREYVLQNIKLKPFT